MFFKFKSLILFIKIITKLLLLRPFVNQKQGKGQEYQKTLLRAK